jgi:hypothetical protein
VASVALGGSGEIAVATAGASLFRRGRSTATADGANPRC